MCETTIDVFNSIDNAIWSWWVHPLAVADPDYNALWLCSIARMGTNRIARIDLDTNEYVHLKLGDRDQEDDHNAGAIAIRPDKSTLLVFYARHASDTYIRWRHVNRETMNVSAQERRLEFPGRVTYAQVLQNDAKEMVAILCRVNSTWQYRYTYDWGATWSDAKMLIDGSSIGQCYSLTRKISDGQYWFAFYGHPSSTSYHKVVTGRLDLDSGGLFSVDGARRLEGSFESGFNIKPEDLDLAIDPPDGWRVRMLDMIDDANGPAIAYATWQGEAEATYHVKRVNELGEWFVEPGISIPTGVPFGHNYGARYVGGMALLSGGEAIVSREAGGAWAVGYACDGNFQMFDMSSNQLVRPISLADGLRSFVFYQFLSKYDSYRDYDSDVLAAEEKEL